jgi:hypothetical protein
VAKFLVAKVRLDKIKIQTKEMILVEMAIPEQQKARDKVNWQPKKRQGSVILSLKYNSEISRSA